jgi:hypothetical protein
MSPAPVMAGFAFITGVFGCFNHRVLDPVRKPKTVTFDAEIPIGENDEGELQCVKGILHYFVPSHEKSPLDDRKYFVSGKVVSISQVDDKENVDYDLQIEALTVRSSVILFSVSICYQSLLRLQLFLMPDIDDPPRTQIMIAGQVCVFIKIYIIHDKYRR